MELNELGAKPISADSPAGADAKYEPEYEALSAEIEKMSSVSGVALDWSKVGSLATTILSQKSKDILVTCYLVASLFYTQGLDGLITGIGVLKSLIENFWENLFPPINRMRARSNAVSWLLERLETNLRTKAPESLPEKTLKSLNEAIEAVDALLGQKMPDAPSCRPLLTILNAIPVEAAEKPQTEQQGDAPQAEHGQNPPAAGSMASGATPAKQSARPASAPVPAADIGTVGSDQDAKKALNSALQNLRKLSDFYMEQDMANPLPYSLTRIAAWLPVENLPPATDGKTRIPPPNDQLKNSLNTLFANGDWMNLVRTAESRVDQFLFWLDLSRMTHEGLGRMGDKYIPAQQAVIAQTAAFIKRLKGVENLAFSDGTPFAGPETRAWLKDISSSGGDASTQAFSAPVASVAGSDEAKVGEQFSKALALANEKKLTEAVTMLLGGLKESATAKSRMIWRMALAQLLVSSKNEKLAIPHLEELLKDIETYKLEEWDPDLALKGLKLVIVGFGSLKEDRYKTLIEQTLDRIARLNPLEALNLTQYR